MNFFTVDKFISQFVSASCALVLFIPGIKFFLFSSVVNTSILLMLLASILFIRIYNNFKINKKQVIYLGYISVIYFLILLSGLFADINVTLNTFMRYTSVWLILISIVILSRHICISFFCNYIIFWSVFLAVLYLSNFITPSGDGELSYLILAMQLGIGFSISLSKFVELKKNAIFYFIVLLFLMYTMLTLSSRAALIGCGMVFVFSIIYLLVVNIRERFILVISSLMILLGCIYFSYGYIYENVLSDYLLYKLTDTNSSTNSRVYYYLSSINLILDNPFGLGLQRFNSVLGFYPHNLFLEMGLNTGLLGMLLLIAPLALFCKVYAYLVIGFSKHHVLSLANLTLFLFTCWMFSNDLGSSYVPFTALIIFLLNSKSRN